MDIDSVARLALFAAAFAALYASHHVGDYWVQTDHQAATKGLGGWRGRVACLAHVGTYTVTQAVALVALVSALGIGLPIRGTLTALIVSGGTHYLADRREYGLMLLVARLVKGRTSPFLRLGVPRAGRLVTAHGIGHRDEEVPLDNPSLGTGAWALDQSWHIALGCFLPALIIAANL